MATKNKNAERLKLLVSYSSADHAHLTDFMAQLEVAAERMLFDCWHDRLTPAGERWSNRIADQLQRADIVVFLLSPAFFASDYCTQEMLRALELHGERGTLLLPILLTECEFDTSPLADWQVTPQRSRPVDKWDTPVSAWAKVVADLAHSAQARFAECADGSKAVPVEASPLPVKVAVGEGSERVEAERVDITGIDTDQSYAADRAVSVEVKGRHLRVTDSSIVGVRVRNDKSCND